MFKTESSAAMSDPGLRLMMQDPYSSMMQQQPRDIGLSSFKSSAYGRTPSSIPSASSPSYYQGLSYSNSSFSPGESYSNMTLPTTTHDYAPMPAHMHSSNSNGLSRPLHSPLSNNNHPLSSASHGPPNMNLLEMTSPHPANNHIESISPPHNDHERAATSSASSCDLSTSKDLSDDSNQDKSMDKDDLECGIPPKKRALSMPEGQKDETYWDKRKKNNESAKRSREARRMKEEQIAVRVVYLEQDNLQLRTEVSLLKNEIEKLRCMLYNS